jgi:hypothetical protein
MLCVQGEYREETEWRQLLTLLVHLVVLSVGRVRVVAVHLAIALRVDHTTRATSRILARDLAFSRLVAERRQLGSDTTTICWWLAGL